MLPDTDMLAAQPLLTGLTERQLQQLAPLASRSMFHAGNRIFAQGAPAEQFWLITDGKVLIDSEVPGYDNIVLEELGPGSVLGWSWLFSPYRWHFGAVAVATTHTLTFNGALVRACFSATRDSATGLRASASPFRAGVKARAGRAAKARVVP